MNKKTNKKTDNLRIKQIMPLAVPDTVINHIPLPDNLADNICKYRSDISDILHGKSDKLLVILGPCSIHDVHAAKEYAKKLAQISKKYEDDLLLVMRVYFEKPRTIVGWKGLINDPYLDGSCQINIGLHLARQLLLDITSMGIPTATEFLDNLLPQYLSDIISWAAIGARTTESQIHRQLASGLSMPVGFKNGTNGNVDIAIQAILSAGQPHHFTGINKGGDISVVQTKGNDDCHVILRGAKSGPNYDKDSVNSACDNLGLQDLPKKLMVDCSHGNSCKDYLKQKDVIANIAEQISSNNHADRVIMGVMLESNLNQGSQKLTAIDELDYGVSITDSCLSWEQTVPLLDELSDAVNASKNI
jgi:3-deoxy-7-phosphoheptulonate synthase